MELAWEVPVELGALVLLAWEEAVELGALVLLAWEEAVVVVELGPRQP